MGSINHTLSRIAAKIIGVTPEKAVASIMNNVYGTGSFEMMVSEIHRIVQQFKECASGDKRTLEDIGGYYPGWTSKEYAESAKLLEEELPTFKPTDSDSMEMWPSHDELLVLNHTNMGPKSLSAKLRQIAAKIDASKQPSRKLVAAELKSILTRLAARTDVLNAVDAVFNSYGIYPPNMKSTGGNTYEGEIDTGWVLTVVDDATMHVKLNGIPVKGLDEAAKAFKNKDNRYTGAKVDRDELNKIFQVLYGRTTPYSTDVEIQENEPENAAGSGLFWEAFEALGIVDWYPGIDPEPVFEKVREIAENSDWYKDPIHGGSKQWVNQAQKNYESYKKYCEADYIKKLEEAGLWNG